MRARSCNYRKCNHIIVNPVVKIRPHPATSPLAYYQEAPLLTIPSDRKYTYFTFIHMQITDYNIANKTLFANITYLND